MPDPLRGRVVKEKSRAREAHQRGKGARMTAAAAVQQDECLPDQGRPIKTIAQQYRQQRPHLRPGCQPLRGCQGRCSETCTTEGRKEGERTRQLARRQRGLPTAEVSSAVLHSNTRHSHIVPPLASRPPRQKRPPHAQVWLAAAALSHRRQAAAATGSAAALHLLLLPPAPAEQC